MNSLRRKVQQSDQTLKQYKSPIEKRFIIDQTYRKSYQLTAQMHRQNTQQLPPGRGRGRGTNNNRGQYRGRGRGHQISRGVAHTQPTRPSRQSNYVSSIPEPGQSRPTLDDMADIEAYNNTHRVAQPATQQNVYTHQHRIGRYSTLSEPEEQSMIITEQIRRQDAMEEATAYQATAGERTRQELESEPDSDISNAVADVENENSLPVQAYTDHFNKQWLKESFKIIGLIPDERYRCREDYELHQTRNVKMFQQQIEPLQNHQLSQSILNQAVQTSCRLRNQRADIEDTGVHVIGTHQFGEEVLPTLLTLTDLTNRPVQTRNREGSEFAAQMWMLLSKLKDFSLQRNYQPTAILITDDDMSISNPDFSDNQDYHSKCIHYILIQLEWPNVKVLTYNKEDDWREQRLRVHISCKEHRSKKWDDMKQLERRLKDCRACRRSLKLDSKTVKTLIDRCDNNALFRQDHILTSQDQTVQHFATLRIGQNPDSLSYQRVQATEAMLTHLDDASADKRQVKLIDILNVTRMAHYEFGHRKGGIIVTIPIPPVRTSQNQPEADLTSACTVFISNTELATHEATALAVSKNITQLLDTQLPRIKNLDKVVDLLEDCIEEYKSCRKEIIITVPALGCGAFAQNRLLHSAKQIAESLQLHWQSICLIDRYGNARSVRGCALNPPSPLDCNASPEVSQNDLRFINMNTGDYHNTTEDYPKDYFEATTQFLAVNLLKGTKTDEEAAINLFKHIDNREAAQRENQLLEAQRKIEAVNDTLRCAAIDVDVDNIIDQLDPQGELQRTFKMERPQQQQPQNQIKEDPMQDQQQPQREEGENQMIQETEEKEEPKPCENIQIRTDKEEGGKEDKPKNYHYLKKETYKAELQIVSKLIQIRRRYSINFLKLADQHQYEKQIESKLATNNSQSIKLYYQARWITQQRKRPELIAAWRYLDSEERDLWYQALKQTSVVNERITQAEVKEIEASERKFIRVTLQNILRQKGLRIQYSEQNKTFPKIRSLRQEEQAQQTSEEEDLIEAAIIEATKKYNAEDALKNFESSITDEEANFIRDRTLFGRPKKANLKREDLSHTVEQYTQADQTFDINKFILPQVNRKRTRLLNFNEESDYIDPAIDEADKLIKSEYHQTLGRIRENLDNLHNMGEIRTQENWNRFMAIYSQLTNHTIKYEAEGNFDDRYREGLALQRILREYMEQTEGSQIIPIPEAPNRNAILLLDSYLPLKNRLRQQFPNMKSIYHTLQPDSNDIQLEHEEETKSILIRLTNKLQESVEQQLVKKKIQLASYQAMKERNENPRNITQQQRQEVPDQEQQRQAQPQTDQAPDQPVNRRSQHSSRRSQPRESQPQLYSEKTTQKLKSKSFRDVGQQSTSGKTRTAEPKQSQIERDYRQHCTTIDEKKQIHNEYADENNKEQAKKLYLYAYDPQDYQSSMTRNIDLLNAFNMLIFTETQSNSNLHNINTNRRRSEAQNHSPQLRSATRSQTEYTLKLQNQLMQIRYTTIQKARQLAAQCSDKDFHILLQILGVKNKKTVVRVLQRQTNGALKIKMTQEETEALNRRIREAQEYVEREPSQSIRNLTEEQERLLAQMDQPQSKTIEILSSQESEEQQERQVLQEQEQSIKNKRNVFITIALKNPWKEPTDTLAITLTRKLRLSMATKIAIKAGQENPDKIEELAETLAQIYDPEPGKTLRQESPLENSQIIILAIMPQERQLEESKEQTATEKSQQLAKLIIQVLAEAEKNCSNTLTIPVNDFNRLTGNKQQTIATIMNAITWHFKPADKQTTLRRIKLITDEESTYQDMLQEYTARSEQAEPFSEIPRRQELKENTNSQKRTDQKQRKSQTSSQNKPPAISQQHSTGHNQGELQDVQIDARDSQSAVKRQAPAKPVTSKNEQKVQGIISKMTDIQLSTISKVSQQSPGDSLSKYIPPSPTDPQPQPNNPPPSAPSELSAEGKRKSNEDTHSAHRQISTTDQTTTYLKSTYRAIREQEIEEMVNTIRRLEPNCSHEQIEYKVACEIMRNADHRQTQEQFIQKKRIKPSEAYQRAKQETEAEAKQAKLAKERKREESQSILLQMVTASEQGLTLLNPVPMQTELDRIREIAQQRFEDTSAQRLAMAGIIIPTETTTTHLYNVPYGPLEPNYTVYNPGLQRVERRPNDNPPFVQEILIRDGNPVIIDVSPIAPGKKEEDETNKLDPVQALLQANENNQQPNPAANEDEAMQIDRTNEADENDKEDENLQITIPIKTEDVVMKDEQIQKHDKDQPNKNNAALEIDQESEDDQADKQDNQSADEEDYIQVKDEDSSGDPHNARMKDEQEDVVQEPVKPTKKKSSRRRAAKQEKIIHGKDSEYKPHQSTRREQFICDSCGHPAQGIPIIGWDPTTLQQDENRKACYQCNTRFLLQSINKKKLDKASRSNQQQTYNVQIQDDISIQAHQTTAQDQTNAAVKTEMTENLTQAQRPYKRAKLANQEPEAQPNTCEECSTQLNNQNTSTVDNRFCKDCRPEDQTREQDQRLSGQIAHPNDPPRIVETQQQPKPQVVADPPQTQTVKIPKKFPAEPAPDSILPTIIDEILKIQPLIQTEAVQQATIDLLEKDITKTQLMTLMKRYKYERAENATVTGSLYDYGALQPLDADTESQFAHLVKSIRRYIVNERDNNYSKLHTVVRKIKITGDELSEAEESLKRLRIRIKEVEADSAQQPWRAEEAERLKSEAEKLVAKECLFTETKTSLLEAIEKNKYDAAINGLVRDILGQLKDNEAPNFVPTTQAQDPVYDSSSSIKEILQKNDQTNDFCLDKAESKNSSAIKMTNIQTKIIDVQPSTNSSDQNTMTIKMKTLKQHSKPAYKPTGRICNQCDYDTSICACALITQRLKHKYSNFKWHDIEVASEQIERLRKDKQAGKYDLRDIINSLSLQATTRFQARNVQMQTFMAGHKHIRDNKRLPLCDGQLVLSMHRIAHAKLPGFQAIKESSISPYRVMKISDILANLKGLRQEHNRLEQLRDNLQVNNLVKRLTNTNKESFLLGDNLALRNIKLQIVKQWGYILNNTVDKELEAAVNSIILDKKQNNAHCDWKPRHEVLFDTWNIYERLLLKAVKYTKEIKEYYKKPLLQIDKQSIQHRNLMDLSKITNSYKKAIAYHWPTFGQNTDPPTERQYNISRLLTFLVPRSKDIKINVKQRRHDSDCVATMAHHKPDLTLQGNILVIPKNPDTVVKKDIWELIDIGIGLQRDNKTPQIMVAAKMSAAEAEDTEQQDENTQKSEGISTHTQAMLDKINQHLEKNVLPGEENKANQQNRTDEYYQNHNKQAIGRQQDRETQQAARMTREQHITPLEGIIRCSNDIEAVMDLINLEVIPSAIPILTAIVEKLIYKVSQFNDKQPHAQATLQFVSLLKRNHPELESAEGQEQMTQLLSRLAQMEIVTTPVDGDTKLLAEVIKKNYEYANRYAFQHWRKGYTTAKQMDFLSYAQDPDNPDHIYWTGIYTDDKHKDGDPIFWTFTDQATEAVASKIAAAEYIDALNVWAGRRVWNTVDDWIQCAYSNKRLDEAVQSLFINKGPSLFTAPLIVCVEGEHIGRVKFSAWKTTEGKELEQCRQNYLQFINVLNSMPCHRVIGEITYRYTAHKTKHQTILPFIYTWKKGWTTKIPHSAGLQELASDLKIHSYCLNEATKIRWHIPTFNNDNNDLIGKDLTERRVGLIQEAYLHMLYTTDKHLNNTDILRKWIQPGEAAHWKSLFSVGPYKGLKRTQTARFIWQRNHNERSHKLPRTANKTRNAMEYSVALRRHLQILTMRVQYRKTYEELTLAQANQLFKEIESQYTTPMETAIVQKLAEYEKQFGNRGTELTETLTNNDDAVDDEEENSAIQQLQKLLIQRQAPATNQNNQSKNGPSHAAEDHGQ